MLNATTPASTQRPSRTIEEFIYTANMRLDEKDFKGWLDMCAPEFTYAIRAFSREIRKEVIWLDHDYGGMEVLIRQLPRHNTDQSEFTRHTTVYTVEQADDESAVVVSAVAIYRTTLDGGETNLFAIGRYTDTLVRTLDGWRFRSRDLRLETRNLGIGTHYPL